VRWQNGSVSIPVIRPRGGYLFAAIVVAHIALISAQVNTSAGIPALQAAVVFVVE
jgi:ribonuclease PH